MERAILFEPFGFLGYSLCKAMLDEGIQVNAFSLMDKNDLFAEEKRMEIGRNANFIETNREDWEEENDKGITPLIIPVYDLFRKKEEMRMIKDKDFNDFLSKLNPESYSITFLLPDQYAYEIGERYDSVEQLICFFSDKGYSYKEIYLPTLYGPWQPEEYYFQQLLFPKTDSGIFPSLNSRESVTDAVYIDDAAHAVFKLLTKVEGKFLIRSQVPNSWFRCLDTLLADQCHPLPEQQMAQMKNDNAKKVERIQRQKGLQTIFIKESFEIPEGFDLQRKQYELWLQSIY